MMNKLFIDLGDRWSVIPTVRQALPSYVADAIGGLNLECDDAVVVGVAGVTEQATLVHAALREVNRSCALRSSRFAAATTQSHRSEQQNQNYAMTP